MSTRLPSDLLDRSAQESSRLLALRYLDHLDRTRNRLNDPGDLEGLHDFRVGLRRLRSSIRAYREHLEGSISGKMRKRLRKLMLATNAGRDAEVQLAWLRKQGERLEGDEVQGLFWLIGRLEGRKGETLDGATADVARRFGKTAAKLRPRLATFQVEVVTGPSKKQPTFGQASGELIQQQVARVGADLARVRGAVNPEDAHRTRISVKRLRYLLEPVVRKNVRARALMKWLKEAQDLLGHLHDMHLLLEEIASSIAAATKRYHDQLAPSERGLRTLERLASQEAATAVENLGNLWSVERANRILLRADEIGSALQEPPGELPMETSESNLPVERAVESLNGVGQHAEGRAI